MSFEYIKIKKRDKKSEGTKWTTTRDENLKNKWIEQGYNIGLLSGANDLFIVDIDCHGDVNGFDSLTANNIELPDTLKQMTPNDGMHFIYKSNGYNFNDTNKIGTLPGVDLRAERAYILLEPSKTFNNKTNELREYKLLDKLDLKNIKPITDENGNLDPNIKMLFNISKKINDVNEKKSFSLPIEIKQSKRNDTLMRYASSLQGKNVSDEDINILLHNANKTRCLPPLDKEEVDRIIKSVTSRYDKGNNKRFIKNGLDISKFLIFNKNGSIKRLHDKKIVDYIKNNYKFITISGDFYFYVNGVYKNNFNIDDTFYNGTQYIYEILNTLIPDEMINSRTRDNIKSMLIQDTNLTFEQQKSLLNNYSNDLINFKNGMYNIKTKKLEKHNPKYFSINQVPHDLELDNKDFSKAKTFNLVINQMIEDKESINMFLDYFALSLTKKPTQQFMYLVGQGGVGKSMLLNFISEVVGKDNISNISIQNLNEKFVNADLFGKTLNLFADLPSSSIKQGDAIKMLFGGDSITVQRKFKDNITFKPYSKGIFSTNTIPRFIDEKSNAYYRRLLILKINKKAEYIKDIVNKLNDEIKFILPELVKRLKKIMDNDNVIIESSKSKEDKNQLRRDTDPIENFIYKCLVPYEGSKCERKYIYEFYKNFCNVNGRKSVNNSSFYNELENRNIIPVKIQGFWCYKDYGLRISEGQKIFYYESIDDTTKKRVFCREGQVIKDNFDDFYYQYES
ncbi:phage/plasmid primase, P4 family [Anaerococcus vaginalis]|uniref:phage/plasmid primase, P4 family n=1 Tax=Anaerococcus vaginalis TaxID=33037 RepID=UPI002907AB59|nr:phage/plasmid primase, P4 family [Anaerococcus vaginalis]MDU5461176.1 phage/plasmid primase, P4 family [Anaerococcus vaginalis]